MPMKRIALKTAAQREKIIAQTAEVLADLYVDARELAAQAVSKIDEAYWDCDEKGLTSFLFFKRSHIKYKDGRISAIYLGLGGNRPDRIGTTRAIAVYRAFIADALTWEKKQKERFLIWGTTATPSIYRIINKFFDELEPQMDGSYSPRALEYANRIKAQFIDKEHWSHEHPFLLKGVAKTVRYSAAERKRIDALAQAKNFDLFSKINMQETNGDRVLLFCRLPISMRGVC